MARLVTFEATHRWPRETIIICMTAAAHIEITASGSAAHIEISTPAERATPRIQGDTTLRGGGRVHTTTVAAATTPTRLPHRIAENLAHSTDHRRPSQPGQLIIQDRSNSRVPIHVVALNQGVDGRQIGSQSLGNKDLFPSQLLGFDMLQDASQISEDFRIITKIGMAFHAYFAAIQKSAPPSLQRLKSRRG